MVQLQDGNKITFILEMYTVNTKRIAEQISFPLLSFTLFYNSFIIFLMFYINKKYLFLDNISNMYYFT
jgi:hypothetical protein